MFWLNYFSRLLTIKWFEPRYLLHVFSTFPRSTVVPSYNANPSCSLQLWCLYLTRSRKRSAQLEAIPPEIVVKRLVAIWFWSPSYDYIRRVRENVKPKTQRKDHVLWISLSSFVRIWLMRVGFLAEVQSSVWRIEKRKTMLRQQSINTELFRILIKVFQSIEGTTATGFWRWLPQATLSSSLRRSFRRHCKEPS